MFCNLSVLIIPTSSSQQPKIYIFKMKSMQFRKDYIQCLENRVVCLRAGSVSWNEKRVKVVGLSKKTNISVSSHYKTDPHS